jgi:NTE family protein
MEFDMVFEGGGAKGMAFIGALRVLEKGQHTSGRLIGTSAGALLRHCSRPAIQLVSWKRC